MAPTGKRVISSLPPQAQLTAQKLERLGFTDWRFIEDHPLPDPAGGIQVRDESSLAPKGNVNLYAENMTTGDLFPPVVVTADGYQIDGRTRNLARRKITRKGQAPVFDAIVLRENFADATTAQLGRFYALAFVLNKHGEKLSDKNAEAVIKQIWQPGMSQIDLARQLGVHTVTVKAVVNALLAARRMEERGIDPSAFNRTVLIQFETKGKDLYEEPFKKTAEVAAKARLTGPEVAELMNELKELKTENSQLELLKGVAEQRKMQIDGVVKKNNLAIQAARNFAWFL